MRDSLHDHRVLNSFIMNLNWQTYEIMNNLLNAVKINSNLDCGTTIDKKCERHERQKNDQLLSV